MAQTMQSLLWRVEFDAACAGLAASRQVRKLNLLLRCNASTGSAVLLWAEPDCSNLH